MRELLATNALLKTLLMLFAFMAVMVGFLVHKQLNPPALTALELKQRGVFIYEQPRLIKDFALQNHHAQGFNKKALQGRWSLVFFGFTHCPDVCPTTLAMLNAAMAGLEDQALRDSTQVLMVTVDPARDTPDQLATYLSFFNADFIGVTGEFLDILAFSGNLNAAFRKVMHGADYSVDHSAYIFLINPYGDLQGFMKPPFKAAGFADNYRQIRKTLPDLAMQ